MAVYSVFSKETSPDAIRNRASDVVFVKEGFSVPAFAFTGIWLLFKRMWIVLLLLIGYELILLTIGKLIEPGPLVLIPAELAVNLILGLEGANLYRWTLGLSGYREIGIEAGNSLEEAEYRFFGDLPAATSAPLAAAASVPPPMSPYDADALGLFSPPGNV